MIKYLELTAPEKSEFRQVKILSIEVAEGDEVIAGDTLFKVKSGKNEIDLPTTMSGKIIEIIATVEENISILTPLILLETEIEDSVTTPTIEPVKASPANKKPSVGKKKKAKTIQQDKHSTKPQTKISKSKKKLNKALENVAEKIHEQQSLDLGLQTSKVTDADKEPDTPSPSLETKENTTMSNIQVTVPDIGADSAKVIEILVATGDQISVDDPLVTLESDKASMDVPSTHAGVVSSIAVAVDQDVNEGTLLLELSTENGSDQGAEKSAAPVAQTDASSQAAPVESTQSVDVTIPDIGGDSAKVIEILVEVGQTVAEEDPLVTLESDKASMDVPSSAAGTIESIEVNIDQDVSEGMVVVKVSSGSSSSSASQPVAPPAEDTPSVDSVIDVVVPDIGGDSAKVIEILVSSGQEINIEDPLVTLESDKASMDVPSPVSGVIESIEVDVEQDVSEGALIAKVLTSAKQPSPANKSAAVNDTPKPAASTQAPQSPAPSAPATGKAHASPSIRRFARELGVDLSKVGGSGRKGRIVKSDVKAFVKNIITGGGVAQTASGSGAGIPPIPAIDFTKFGEIDIQPLNKIKKLTAANLHRSWLNVPLVTHHDESNISDLEDFRKQLNKEYAAKDKGIKLSPLAFIVKAAVHALRTYPQFNSSLEPGGENIIYKKYIHIGIAVETPNGLVVPVIRNADKMSISEIALAMGELAQKARDKKLSPADMSGASFTISSLGGIGGTSFTPLVNAPEVAILGVSRSKIQPVWNGKEFEPGMILPLSLSYDHRIIDGAEAARFTAHIAAALEDVRRLTV